ncbi:MAG: rod shape-determining protein [Lachnospiraceae bacterium]|nr:rod shape-determining protein [Lachnospiraceae bacterium]
MGNPEQLVFGLDIGTRSIVGTVGYKQSMNDFTVVAQDVKMHDTRAMMDGQIHDINKVAETIAQVKHSLEKQTGRKLEEVCIAAAGRVLKTVTVHVETEFTQEVTVDTEMIRALELLGVEKAYQQIKEESQGDDTNYYCVAYTVIKYYLNDFSISNLEDHKAKRIAADVLTTFLPDEVIGGLYTAVEKAGLKVANLTLEPIAAIQVAIPEKFRLLNIALVDVGAGTSDISITKEGSIIAYGMIPMAGDALTEQLVGAHLVDFATAEQIKMDINTEEEVITYTDIMGLSQTTTPEEVRAELQPIVDSMTRQVAEKIKELNGGKPVSAVFVVGGGGKIAGYTESLAGYLGIQKERVALRGEEVLGFVRFQQQEIKKDPMLVTPIGICLNYYEDKNNFIFVNVNGESVKLYDNNRLTVIDAAMQNGFPNECLFPRRGKELNFTLDGVKRMIRGEAGEAAEIWVNGRPAAVNSPIEPNAKIEIKESTVGKAAALEVRQLPEYRSNITFTVNKKQVVCPKFIEVNGTLVSEYYSIQEGDELKLLSYYTLEKLLEFMDLPYTGHVYVNNRPAGKEEKVYENFSVEWSLEEKAGVAAAAQEYYQETAAEHEEEKQASSMDQQETRKTETQVLEKTEPAQPAGTVPVQGTSSASPLQSTDVTVIVNGRAVTLKGKSSYWFVDILDFYPFDVSTAHGQTVVTQINGEKADFSHPVKAGDVIDLYWK